MLVPPLGSSLAISPKRVSRVSSLVILYLISNSTILLAHLQIGLAYALGIVIALIVSLHSMNVRTYSSCLPQTCSSTSGGHFNPAVTIAFVLFRKFPPLKAVRYCIRP